MVYTLDSKKVIFIFCIIASSSNTSIADSYYYKFVIIAVSNACIGGTCYYTEDKIK